LIEQSESECPHARKTRPVGVSVLSIFFLAATLITTLAAISLLFPNGLLEPIWKLNPRGRTGLSAIGFWAVLLFVAVAIGCAVAAVGLWQGRRWGYFAAIAILSINFLGDLYNVISGAEPRAAIGIPIVTVILVYLLRRKVRLYFR
jgi:uncharacterized membrane protein (DUF2068 family)